MRTKEGMAIARAKGKLKGKKPKLSDRRQASCAACMTRVTTRSAIWQSCSTYRDQPSIASCSGHEARKRLRPRYSCRSLRGTWRTHTTRTNPPFAIAAIADAAFVRGCRAIFAALQPKSPDRPFKAMMKPGFQTAPSLQRGSTIKMRDEAAVRNVGSMAAAIGVLIL